MKKIINILLIIIFIFIIKINLINANDDYDETLKRYISIVYDDSGSMNNNEEYWAYASYSMQNLIALMNSQDELSVTKMSNPLKNEEYILTDNNIRISNIKSIESWKASSMTPFKAVETAVNWLKDKKENCQTNENIEFWLIVITDGEFNSDYPTNIKQYLEEVKMQMSDNKYEGILVSIGNNVPKSLKQEWQSTLGYHLIEANKADDITTAMKNVSKTIQGKSEINETEKIKYKQDNNTLSFISQFPLKKIIIYQQQQNININTVEVEKEKMEEKANFDTKYPGTKVIVSNITHYEPLNKSYIEPGKVVIKSNDLIDTSDDKFNIFIEPAIKAQIKILDKNENELNNLTVSKNSVIKFEVTTLNSVNNKEIKLQEWEKDLKANLIVNNKTIELKYNPKTNKFTSSYLTQDKNLNIYAVVSLPGYFRTKTNAKTINIKNEIDNIASNISKGIIEVPYKYINDYEEIATFQYQITGIDINDICHFKFNNIPQGIKIIVDGKNLDKNNLVSIRLNNDVPIDIKIYRNKDYKEKKEKNISINVTNDKYDLIWKEDSIKEFVLKPKKRKILIESNVIKENFTIDINKFKEVPIYYVSLSTHEGYLEKEELEKILIELTKNKNVNYEIIVEEYDNHYALKLISVKNRPKIFLKTGKYNDTIKFKTIYNEEVENKYEYEIKDNILKYMEIALIITILILLIGYLPGIKKRIPKGVCIKTENETNAINIKKITRIMPYIKEKAYSSDLTLIATSNKNKISIINDFLGCKKITLNGEAIDLNNKNIDIFIDEELKIYTEHQERKYIYSKIEITNEFDNYKNYNDFMV